MTLGYDVRMERKKENRKNFFSLVSKMYMNRKISR